jgi:hypothetical protein
MNYQISGTFYQTNPEQVQALLDSWLAGAQHRSRLFGHTWEFKTDQIVFHLETSDAKSAKYFLDTRFMGTNEESVKWTEGLVNALRAADILYLLSRVEFDDQDLDVGEEVTYTHPEFEVRYVPQGD